MSSTSKTVAAALAPTTQRRLFGRRLFVGRKGMPAAAVVLTVSVAVPVGVVVPAKLIGPPTEHVGGSAAPTTPVTLHDSVIAPVNPPVPVAVIVEVPDCPGVAIVTAVDASVNAPGVVTVTVTVVVTTLAPLVPVTVTVYADNDVVAVVVTVSVEVCEAPSTIDGLLNEQVGVDVRFVGATLQVSATVPVNPFVGATVITDVPELPATTEGLLAEDSVKLSTGAAVTVTVTGVVTTVAPLVPVTVTV
jgi:hypothetical protein